MSEWIDVKDGLPTEVGEAFVYISTTEHGRECTRTQVLFYCGNNKWEGDMGWSTTEGFGITHWMPLPEPPKERLRVAEINSNLTQSQHQNFVLEPCPFCGGVAEMQVTAHVPKGYDYTPRCKNTSCCGRISKKYSSEEMAVAKWNTRMRRGI